MPFDLSDLLVIIPVLVVVGLLVLNDRYKRSVAREKEHRAKVAVTAARMRRDGLTEIFRSRRDFLAGKRFDSVDLSSAIAVDERRSCVWLVDCRGYGGLIDRVIDASDIMGIRLVEQGESLSETVTDRNSQLVGALVGDMLAGSTGAIIGGLSGRTMTTSKGFSRRIELEVEIEDLDCPLWRFIFSDELLPTASFTYTSRRDQARQWETMLNALIRRGRRTHSARADRSDTPMLPDYAPSETLYNVARGGKDLGEMPVALIHRMVDAGELSLDEDFYFDPQEHQWKQLLLLSRNATA